MGGMTTYPRRTAVITGASTGLGRALAQLLAEGGWRLVIDARRTEQLAVAQRELALLNAVGWRRRRIAFLVLAEGVATSVLGAGLGMLIGVIGANALNHALGVSSVVSPHVTLWTIGQALLIGVAIGVLGGLYPAWRGTTVAPTRVLGGA